MIPPTQHPISPRAAPPMSSQQATSSIPHGLPAATHIHMYPTSQSSNYIPCHISESSASPSSEGYRPHHTTSKGFGRAYELRRNAKEDPWCGRPARYMRRRAIHPPSLTTIETSLGHTSLIYAPVRSTTVAHLGPNANMSSPMRTCRSQHDCVNPHSTQDECLDVFERTLSHPPADCDALDLY